MVQRPLKKVTLQKKATKYKKVLAKVRTQNDLLTKEINRGILEKYEALRGKRRR